MRIPIFLLLSVWFLQSCSPISQRGLNKTFKATEKNFQDYTGFALYDLEKQKTIYEYNADKYFTPASNTKIFTFFASLNIIGDSIPALRYVETEDSLIFWGTGDPSFLYKNVFTDTTVYDFLKSKTKPLYFSNTNFQTAHFGSGWAWDDYNDYYSPERSPFPVYGNIFTAITIDSSIQIKPRYFQQFYKRGKQQEKAQIVREVFSNHFTYNYKKTQVLKEWEVPFHLDQELITNILADTLKKEVKPVSKQIPLDAKYVYSIPSDSVYKEMMHESDNFIAEQLLLICSGILSDSLQPEIAIKRVKENFLKDLRDEPIWVDGSGLSRYNLFTPRSIVQLWEKIYKLKPREQLFPLLATGGKYGTIKNWYKQDKPFIFGKTGSLSNNHCLSGYLVTKSGKTLIFSFMNSNFTATTNDIRQNMQSILKKIYDEY
jgi:serine-type D-Ala-D-Ala carboxypeptidase/endopeptidase (penicillin-binding protein 4)